MGGFGDAVELKRLAVYLGTVAALVLVQVGAGVRGGQFTVAVDSAADTDKPAKRLP